MEVNRLSRETGHYVLDGVMGVIDVENWKGYEDISMTAKVQVLSDLHISPLFQQLGILLLPLRIPPLHTKDAKATIITSC